VSQAVVHHFEPVEIDIQHGELEGGIAPRPSQGPGKLSHEPRTIGKTGERIMGRLILQPVFGGLVIRDVGERTGNADRFPIVVPHDHASAPHPPIAEGLVLQPVHEFEMLVWAGLQHVQACAHGVGVAGMNAIEPLGRTVTDFLLLVSEHLLPPRR